MQQLYKYAIVIKIVYIRMSNTGDQHPYYVWHPEEKKIYTQ